MNVLVERIYKYTKTLHPSDAIAFFEFYLDELHARLNFSNKPLHGIVNLGNTCYFNAMLQLLYALPNLKYKELITKVSTSQSIYYLLSILQLLEDTDYIGIHKNTKRMTVTVTGTTTETETATERFGDLVKKTGIEIGTCTDINEILTTLFLSDYPLDNMNIKIQRYKVLDNVQGKIGEAQTTRILNLSITNNEKNLSEILNSYINPPVENSVENSVEKIIEQIEICGDTIILSLNRFNYQNKLSQYINKHIAFPEAINIQNTTYRLVSFSVFIYDQQTETAEINNGHYVTLACPSDIRGVYSNWYLFDDTDIEVYDNSDKTFQQYLHSGYIYIYVKTDSFNADALDVNPFMKFPSQQPEISADMQYIQNFLDTTHTKICNEFVKQISTPAKIEIIEIISDDTEKSHSFTSDINQHLESHKVSMDIDVQYLYFLFSFSHRKMIKKVPRKINILNFPYTFSLHKVITTPPPPTTCNLVVINDDDDIYVQHDNNIKILKNEEVGYYTQYGLVYMYKRTAVLENNVPYTMNNFTFTNPFTTPFTTQFTKLTEEQQQMITDSTEIEHKKTPEINDEIKSKIDSMLNSINERIKNKKESWLTFINNYSVYPYFYENITVENLKLLIEVLYPERNKNLNKMVKAQLIKLLNASVPVIDIITPEPSLHHDIPIQILYTLTETDKTLNIKEDPNITTNDVLDSLF